MNYPNEKELVEKAKSDPESFGKLYETYYSPILHYVLKRVGSIQIAEDITSQIFYIMLKKLWQFRWRNIPFSAWLYRIANNEINYYFRKNKYSSLSLELLLEKTKWEPADSSNFEEELKEGEKILQDHQEFLAIQKLITNLPTKYQEIIILKYFEKKKICEISLILNKKENTVKSLLKRALALLQIKVKHQKLLQQIPHTIITKDE